MTPGGPIDLAEKCSKERFYARMSGPSGPGFERLLVGGVHDLSSAMKVPAVLERIDGALGRLLDALSDPKRRDRTVVIVLAVYWAIWTVYAVVAKASQDFHFDMGEMVAWSREVTFGTPKHPPLPAWLVGAWFWIFPLATWAYDLFAVVNATMSLWASFVVLTRHLECL